jgi:hypothetical protein
MKNIKLAIIICAIAFSSCKRDEIEVLTQGEQNAKEIEKIINEAGINNLIIFFVAPNPDGRYFYEVLAKGNIKDHYFRGSLICSKDDCFDLSNLIRTEIFNDRNPYRGTRTLEIHLKL